jgi:quercetin dioxygenase-like cupin family protein
VNWRKADLPEQKIFERIPGGQTMTNEKTRTSVLQACLGKEQALAELVEYSDDSIVSKTILDKPAGAVTLFAFDKGQKLSEHTAPYDALVQILDGHARLTIGGEDMEVLTGQIVIMPGNVPHAVRADAKFKMLLTMIRA